MAASTQGGASRGQVARWLAIALALIVLDQLTKALIVSHYQLGEGTPVTGFFNIVRVHNTGAAFSFLAQAGGWQRWFFTAIGVIASTVIIVMLRRHGEQRLFGWALTLILGGAIGNVIDRVVHSYVVDFLDFHAGGWHFPAFNVADIAISVGAALLILDELLRLRRGS